MKRNFEREDLKDLSNATIFSRIYEENIWGGKKGEFYSGPSSHNPYIEAYTKIVVDFVKENNIKEIVEIGCGDFSVSSKILNTLNKAEYHYHYTGYDVVEPLIKRNTSLFSSAKINFDCKDSCVEDINSGDLLIVRQVLQHLSNKSIQQVVNKFNNYKFIIFTEHQASEEYVDVFAPNIDQDTGASIRLYKKSGVYLDKEPFNCLISSKLYSIPEKFYDIEAFINTYLIKTN